MSIRWDAEDYARHSGGQFGWALSNVERLALRGHEHVLDLGCGDGKVTAEIARLVPGGRVVGIDKSRDMIDFAKRNFAAQHPNVAFRVGDAETLDLAAQFDVVFSNSTLHWIPDHPAVIRGLFQALRSGGRIFLSMSGRGTASGVLEAIAELAVLPPWAESLRGASFPYYFFGREEYEAWLPAAGFLPCRIELVPRPMRHTSLSALEGWLRSAWMPYTDRVSNEDRGPFLTELARRVAARCVVANDGALLLPMVNLEIEAEKPTTQIIPV